MRARGYIDFSLILYYSYQILQANPFVAEGVSSRFQWMLVDEFQDTTEIQLAIFETLHDKGHSGFFLVGDENQSILGFAGARPEAAHRFADSVGANRAYSLSGNFRSGPHIVGMAERLIAREPAMHSVGDAATFNFPPQYVHVAQPVVAVTDYFLPWLEAQRIPFGKAAILAPWWRHLVPIARYLRELGVPVVGPGARPYQKRRLFVGLAEQLGACVEAEHFLNISGVEKAIFRLVQEALGETRFDVFSYEGRRTSLALIYEAKRIADMGLGGVDWLKQCSDGSSDILISDGWISESQRGLLRASVDDMLADMKRRNVDTENMQIADLGIFANPEKAIQLITFHLSKGREFDAAALVSVNEGKIPFFKATTQAEFDEARRLFYVGITRPKKLLLDCIRPIPSSRSSKPVYQ
jgi:DNA helicase-2/ATP-dependent DNA helicase PcrA